jgi:3-hydroxyisobutyrate dehydrogenase-like beta-hydroxyacid dehydrogenase
MGRWRRYRQGSTRGTVECELVLEEAAVELEQAAAVGVVGLGAMGGRFAGRMLDAGYEVHGTDRTATPAQPLIARGLHWHDTLREVAAAVDVVISMVTDDSAGHAREHGRWDEATFHSIAPLLRHLGQTVTRVGGSGAGTLLKPAINIGLAVKTLAFSEGLLVAERGGIDPRKAAQVTAGSPIGSPMGKTRVRYCWTCPTRPGSRSA